ncbi:MAG: flagellar hook-length control protein FliK [Oleispira sp.]|nr:flagellar hook-length control protein FliK [Oleispira sp.]MBL4880478.1 flagellar hook-length control protein FliK [Oleispira sp.]
MDRIPLINPKLIKVSATTERAPTSVLRAEVISSTPIKETAPSQGQETRQQEYKVVLKIGQQQLETISNNDLKKGSLLEVKVLPGPKLKIINSEPKLPLAALPTSPTATPQAKALVQQLLADRIPQIQQQDLPNLIKQLSQIINFPVKGSSPAPVPASPLPTATAESTLQIAASENTYSKTGAKLTNPQTLANQLYLPQDKSTTAETEVTSTKNSTANTAVQQVKAWLQQLPKEQDISNSTGLRNALNGAGMQAEKQLSNLAQQSLNLVDKKSANNIFQQLQSLHKVLVKELTTKTDTVLEPKKDLTSDKAEPNTGLKTNLASIVKRTAKALSDNSQAVLSNLVRTRTPSTAITKTRIADSPLTTSTLTTTNTSANLPSSTTTQWQNPLLNNSLMSLDDLLQSPLLQNPSSNNKFALSQILSGHSVSGQGDQLEGLRIPLNWPERSGNDAVLIRNLQNLLGHIEREQIQQMQSTEANQSNNPNQLQQNQQWVPLLINYQQQLQLIEFYMDKEERLNQAGEKKQHWFINLHFDLPRLGKLGIEISMLDNECNTTFWSESPSSLSQLSQHIKPLRQRLTEQGIVVTDIQSRHGTLEKRKHNIQQRLVDIKT